MRNKRRNQEFKSEETMKFQYHNSLPTTMRILRKHFTRPLQGIYDKTIYDANFWLKCQKHRAIRHMLMHHVSLNICLYHCQVLNFWGTSLNALEFYT